MIFDFDGTLTPLTLLPDFPRLTSATKRHLVHLSKIYTVIILSGRSVKDLKKLTAGLRVKLIGNHGIEGLPEFRNQLRSAKNISQKWAENLKTTLPQFSKLFLENKNYSLCFHYAKAPRKRLLTQQLITISKALKPAPRLIPGTDLLNLIPRSAPTKADAVRRLQLKFRKTPLIYIGDDALEDPIWALNVKNFTKTHIGPRPLPRRLLKDGEWWWGPQKQIDELMKTFIKLGCLRFSY